MLGYKDPLKWTYKDGITTVSLPAKLQKAAGRPCEHAWIFKVSK